MAVTVLMTFFWVMALCGLVGRSQRFGKACCLHLQGSRSSALKVETAHFFGTLASTNQSTLRLNSKERYQYLIPVYKYEHTSVILKQKFVVDL
jgi:hypothetical protein